MPQPKIPTHPHQHLKAALAAHHDGFARMAEQAAEVYADREKAREELSAVLKAESSPLLPPDGDPGQAA